MSYIYMQYLFFKAMVLLTPEIRFCIKYNTCIFKGMVLLSPGIQPSVCYKFEADVFLLFHSSQITTGFETTLHVGSVCQTCRIEYIYNKVKIICEIVYYQGFLLQLTFLKILVSQGLV